MEGATIKRSFCKYVSLNVIGMIGLSCYILADTFFVARGVGATGLAALNLAIPFYSFVHGAGLMIGIGGAIRFVIARSGAVFTQALYYAALAACCFVTAGIFFSEQIASLLGANGETLAYASTYLQIILLFSPMFLLNNVIICFVRNDGNPKLAMCAMLIGSFSNVILDYVFIFPYQMGIFGAALATGIAPVVSLLILSLHFLQKRNTFRLSRQAPCPKVFADLSTLGVSALITELSSGIVIIVFNMLILRLEGNTGVAAYGIVANIALIVVAIFTGISQGMQPIISYYFRERDSRAVHTVLRYGFYTAAALALLVYLTTALFADPLVGAFNKDGDLRLAEIAVRGLRIYFAAFLFVGINILSAAFFCAIDRPKYAFLISLLRGFALIIPVALLLALLFGMNGVWIAVGVTEFAVLFVCVALLRRVRGERLFRFGSTAP